MDAIVNLRKRQAIIDPKPNDRNRHPLKETSGNIPSPPFKKAKLNKPPVFKPTVTPQSITTNKPNLTQPAKFQIHQSHKEKDNKEKDDKQAKSTRLVGDELRNWQMSWRKIMRESVVYFDTQGFEAANDKQFSDWKKASKALGRVGCNVSPFFDRQVSIIVSRRPFNPNKDYPSTDIFHEAVQYKIKVWDYEKVFRFLKNLEEPSSKSGPSNTLTPNNSVTNANGNLSNLLKEERIFGSTDRDPNAKRDDLHYLDKDYLYVYDLSQNVRPISVREWSSSDYPSLHMTLDGKCPFIPDTSENGERKKLRRLEKFTASKEYRELLQKVTSDIMNNAKESIHLNSSGFTGTSTSTDKLEHEMATEEDSAEALHENDTIEFNHSTSSNDSKKTKYNFKAPPAPLMRNSSCVHPQQNSNSKFYDVAASGYNGASNAMQFSMDSTLNSTAAAAANNGNGLGPMVSQVPSRNINNLKRRIFIKKQKQKPTESQHPQHQASKHDKELRPGYCENCRIKYDHFDDHIVSNRHRNFACDDRNFKDIDDLIATLNESKSLGYVTSNGDFRYSA